MSCPSTAGLPELGRLMAEASDLCVQAPYGKSGDGIWSIVRLCDGTWTFELLTYALAEMGRRITWEGIEDPAEMVDILAEYIPKLQTRLERCLADEGEGW